MSHEIFAIERKPELDETEQRRATYLDDKRKLASDLGLTVQADRIMADFVGVVRGRLITTPPMTAAELTIWRAWLPTVYDDIGKNSKRRELAGYDFDRIPQPVLAIWKSHKDAGAFERFEIWTPENDQPDPILVGVNGTTRHLLARWGESDANLVSFPDIKQALRRRWYAGERIVTERGIENRRRMLCTQTGVALGVIAGLATIFTAGPASWSLIPAIYSIALTSVLAMASGVLAYWLYRTITLKRLWITSPLMRAIDADDAQKYQQSRTG